MRQLEPWRRGGPPRACGSSGTCFPWAAPGLQPPPWGSRVSRASPSGPCVPWQQLSVLTNETPWQLHWACSAPPGPPLPTGRIPAWSTRGRPRRCLQGECRERLSCGEAWDLGDSWIHRTTEGPASTVPRRALGLEGHLRSKGKLWAELTLQTISALSPQGKAAPPQRGRASSGWAHPLSQAAHRCSLTMGPWKKAFHLSEP